MREVFHYIGGRPSPGSSPRRGEVFDPASGQVQAHVPLGAAPELAAAVQAALGAQPDWASASAHRRTQVLFRFKALLERHLERLATLLAAEHGKVLADARGELQRGLEVIDFVCGAPQLLKGEFSQGVGPDIDVWSLRQPLGVVAGITPFNFPAMIPLWMLGPAIAAGNAFILKPSERTPSVAVELAVLLQEAGAPEGILNVVHGDREMVEAILAEPAIKAVSFVGSSAVAQHIYATAAAAGKRVQAMGGAKNHGLVLPDADLDQAVAAIVGAAFGSAGERCMALPVIVAIGEDTAVALRQRLKVALAALRVGAPDDPDADYGPLVTAAHKQRVEQYIALAVAEGAELVVDGRGLTVAGHAGGFFLGPTLFDQVGAHMRSYQEEIFGPVLQMLRVDTLEQAIALVSGHPYGNGVALFTRSGEAARRFAEQVEVGMVGINVPIPVPVAHHGFGGWKRSAFGDLNQYGTDSIRFFTRTKIITQRWSGSAASGSAFVMPSGKPE
ncbi:MAG TPA: CoA-acylating methylmalonate-semialdehyde dehydrogenase [Steroidobacteraceae bacterium]|jgi:malonate-semialdehyde dehydrogenase (acetylating)/methylmalonate-semialdehyde dehydrogenase|nr:CoA-acylating methylmalonate-semialdehyde dehydrogenase [Steroidobacteraceae bacterium]